MIITARSSCGTLSIPFLSCNGTHTFETIKVNSGVQYFNYLLCKKAFLFATFPRPSLQNKVSLISQVFHSAAHHRFSNS